jgi:hypothetical protein
MASLHWRWLGSIGLFSLCIVSACSDGPKSPTTPSPGGASPPGVALTGIENYGAFVLVGETVRLKAMERLPDNTVRDCTSTATWKSSDVSILMHGLGEGDGPEAFWAMAPGTATLSATCDGYTGSQVISPNYYKLQVLVRDAVTGAGVPNMRLNRDGRYVTGPDGRCEFPKWNSKDFYVSVDGFGYEPREGLHFFYNRQPELDVTIDMTPVPGAPIFEYNGFLCTGHADCTIAGQSYLQEAHFIFNVPRAGTLRIDGFLGPDGYESRGAMRVTILHNNAIVAQRDVTGTLNGADVLDTPVESGAYELKVFNATTNNGGATFRLRGTLR